LVASFHFLVDTDFYKYNIASLLANDGTKYRKVAPDACEPLVALSQLRLRCTQLCALMSGNTLVCFN